MSKISSDEFLENLQKASIHYQEILHYILESKPKDMKLSYLAFDGNRMPVSNYKTVCTG